MSVTSATIAALVVAGSFAQAQMLARPGWNGSSVAVQSLAKYAVIYEIDTRSFADSNGDGVGDLKGITQHLDYLQTLGVDAILLDSLLPSADESSKLATPIDAVLGTVDDFDDLSLQASRHNIRILLDLPDAHAGLARFWLTQGIAGFHVSSGAQSKSSRLAGDSQTAQYKFRAAGTGYGRGRLPERNPLRTSCCSILPYLKFLPRRGRVLQRSFAARSKSFRSPARGTRCW